MKSFFPAVLAVALLSPAFPARMVAQAPNSGAPATKVDSPEILELQKVEDNWAISLNNRDQYGLELVLSPLFVGVSSSGDVTTRNQQVVAMINQEDKTANMEMRVVTVRMLGDVAVASGTYTYGHKGPSGPLQEKGIFTHVFQKLHGNWVCLNAQRTMLRESNPNKEKAAKPKSSSELPFHIPLFSKSDKTDKTGPSDQPKQ